MDNEYLKWSEESFSMASHINVYLIFITLLNIDGLKDLFL